MFYFTPLLGFFSPFPHGTISLSVIQEYLALRGGPRKFTGNYTCFLLLRIQYKIILIFDYKTFTFFGIVFQIFHLTKIIYVYCPTTPTIYWFRLFPFRSPLLRESFLLFFPPGTKMFQFPGFALSYLYIQ